MDPTQNFSPDLPISSASEDRLNRSSFANALAAAIRNWNQKSSLVLALYGDWGSGKSSVKNMILESLQEGVKPEDHISVIEFNPWQINNQDNLSKAFFDEIGSVLGRPRHGEVEEDAKRRAAKWKSYSAYFSVGTSITKSLKVVLPLLGVPILGDTLDAVVQGLEKAAGVSKEGAEGIEAAGKAAAGTLQNLKKEVADSLASLERPVLVVLDDVDRLAHEEIRLLFQLIKANADFPNLIYLVLAQRETVVKALEPIAPGQGQAFLEKIIQVGFNVPRIGRRQLELILFAGLDRFLADEVVGRRFDQEHWVNLYRDGLAHFFINLRDVNRYLSSLGFHVGVFRSAKSFEVNPVDLIAIETVRVFAPALYNALPDAKHILTDQPRFMRSEERKQDEAALASLFDLVPETDREAAKKIICELFPPAAQVLAGSHYSGNGGDNWFADLRIAAHEVFDRYFHFATPPGDLAQAELEEVIGLIGDREALGRKLKDLQARNLLDVLLDRLDSYKEKLPLESVLSCVTALFDLDVDGNDEFFAAQFSPRTHICRIVHWYVRKEPDQARRKDIILKALDETTGLTTPISMVTWLETKATDTQPTDPSAVLERRSDVDDVRAAAAVKIRAAAQSGRLADDKDMGFLVRIWDAWGPPDEAKKWVAEFIESDPGLLRFLTVMRETSRSYGGRIPKEHHYYRVSAINAFVPVGEISTRVRALDVRTLPEEDARNIALFIKASERNQDGPSFFDIMGEMDSGGLLRYN